jgi:hypothetical protein
MVEAISIVGQLILRRAIEESYRHLPPLYREGHRVNDVLLDPHGGFQVWVTNYRGNSLFTISLSLVELAKLDDAELLMYLVRQYIECMPDVIRAYCSDDLDEWAVQFGKPTRKELLERLLQQRATPIPVTG